MDEQQKLYIKGFETGYWLQRGDNPILPQIMEANANGNAYDKGLRAGKKEAEREKVRQRLQENKDKSNNPEKGIDID